MSPAATELIITASIWLKVNVIPSKIINAVLFICDEELKYNFNLDYIEKNISYWFSMLITYIELLTDMKEVKL